MFANNNNNGRVPATSVGTTTTTTTNPSYRKNWGVPTGGDFWRQPDRNFGPFCRSPGPKSGALGNLRAKNARFTVCRGGISSHGRGLDDPENGLKSRAWRDSVPAESWNWPFWPKRCQTSLVWGPSDLKNGSKFLSDCRQKTPEYETFRVKRFLP